MSNSFRKIFEAPKILNDTKSIRDWLNKILWHKLGQVEEWHEIGATNEPAFTNSWVNLNTAVYAPVAFYKDPYGRVHIRGAISTGTVGSAAFTLPSGYRPILKLIYGTISNSAIGRVDVSNTGTVTPITPSNNAWVSLDGISFRAEQ